MPVFMTYVFFPFLSPFLSFSLFFFFLPSFLCLPACGGCPGSTLSRCAHSALAMLYPFTWQHTFVPVLPASMLDISCSPTPFLMGALSPSLSQVLELPIEEVSVCLVSLLLHSRLWKNTGNRKMNVAPMPSQCNLITSCHGLRRTRLQNSPSTQEL